MKDSALWERLRAYAFPLSDGRGTLQAHLAAKTRLRAEKAARVVDEYRKFLYLAATSTEVVAPSPLIDRVWHMHIEDTRAYIDDFAAKVIGRMIHHRPGRAMAAKDPAYQTTLALYQREFGEPPFVRVWPTPDTLKSDWLRALVFIGLFIAAGGISQRLQTPLFFFAAVLVLIGSGFWIQERWGYWTVRTGKDGSGCSSCGGGDGGCGGD